MLFLSITSDAFFHALVWMLIHSFWQGLIAAALAGLVILFTRNLSPALRYNLLVMAGCLFVIVVAYTFLAECRYFMDSSASMELQDIQSGRMKDEPVIISKAGGIENGTIWVSSISHFINQYISTILLLWLSVLVFKSIRLTIGFYHVMNLRKKELVAVNPFWAGRILELCRETGVRSTVRIFQSGLAKIPMVIGFFKPVILVPLGFFTCLPPEEIDAILVHELAHIRRRDYLVNMIQNLLELLFFFNPFVLWISAAIRKERENCCDDIAVRFAGNKECYINALVAFNESNIASRFATSFGGYNKMPLLERIQRLIYNKNKTLNKMEKISLLTGVILISLMGYAFKQKEVHQKEFYQNSLVQNDFKKLPLNIEKDNNKNAVSILNVVSHPQAITTYQRNVFEQISDTSGKGKTEITIEIEGIKYRLIFIQDRLVELHKNGVQVPKSEFNEYDSIIQKVLEYRKKAEENASKAQEHAEKAHANELKANEHEKTAQASVIRAQEFETKAASKALMAQEHAQQAQEMELEVQAKAKESQIKALEVEKQHAAAIQHEAQAAQYAKNVAANALEAEGHAKYAQLHSAVYTEFLKDALIKENEQHFNYSIRDGKLFINDKEQSQAVYQKYNQLINELKQKLGIQ